MNRCWITIHEWVVDAYLAGELRTADAAARKIVLPPGTRLEIWRSPNFIRIHCELIDQSPDWLAETTQIELEQHAAPEESQDCSAAAS